jgi:hypothetical protein
MWLEFPFDPAYLKVLRVGQGQSERVTPEVTEQVARLLVVLGGQTLSLQELMQALGLSHRPNFLALHLRPALAANLIQMTVPDKPNSRLQKYRLTQAVQSWVAGQG